jgi:hypothetical protein
MLLERRRSTLEFQKLGDVVGVTSERGVKMEFVSVKDLKRFIRDTRKDPEWDCGYEEPVLATLEKLAEFIKLKKIEVTPK